ncbi:uncharacterized protein LOC135276023 isoform X1 [Aotus nancymaae]|uniref:uncharacterized protein LOC135276023 isoform X1 n=1 Tax=Aotus nancymaae TaxID=37293 RepID=UPI0030FE8692
MGPPGPPGTPGPPGPGCTMGLGFKETEGSGSTQLLNEPKLSRPTAAIRLKGEKGDRGPKVRLQSQVGVGGLSSLVLGALSLYSKLFLISCYCDQGERGMDGASIVGPPGPRRPPGHIEILSSVARCASRRQAGLKERSVAELGMPLGASQTAHQEGPFTSPRRRCRGQEKPRITPFLSEETSLYAPFGWLFDSVLKLKLKIPVLHNPTWEDVHTNGGEHPLPSSDQQGR